MIKNRRFFDVYISWIIIKMLDVIYRIRVIMFCIWDFNKNIEIKEFFEYVKYCKNKMCLMICLRRK